MGRRLMDVSRELTLLWKDEELLSICKGHTPTGFPKKIEVVKDKLPEDTRIVSCSVAPYCGLPHTYRYVLESAEWEDGEFEELIEPLVREIT